MSILFALLLVGTTDALRLNVPAGRSRPLCMAVSTMPLLDAISEAGVVGCDATRSSRRRWSDLHQSLLALATMALAKVPLSGTYELLYSMSKGGSSGKVGPLVGKVTQIIVMTGFINQVELFGGALTIQLHAKREVIDDDRIRVSFVETVFMLFGIELKRSPAKGQGVWEQVYVERGLDGSAQLRVMRTPSLFVLRQKAAAQ